MSRAEKQQLLAAIDAALSKVPRNPDGTISHSFSRVDCAILVSATLEIRTLIANTKPTTLEDPNV